MASYLAAVRAQCERKSSLSNLCDFLTNDRNQSKECRIATIGFTRTERVIRHGTGGNGIAAAIQDEYKEGNQWLGRIMIIEDLSRDIIELLNQRFQIDPAFFSGHIDSPAVKVGDVTPALSTLPSFERSRAFSNVRYHRILRLDEEVFLPKKLLRFANVKRRVTILKPMRGVSIGIAQHCCSILNIEGGQGLWTSIILVDPPISDIYARHDKTTAANVCLKVASKLFQGGYEDFHGLLPPLQRTSGTARYGLYDDLVHYWKDHVPPGFQAHQPSLLSLAYQPLQVVAAEWVIYLQLMFLSIKHFEHTVDDTQDLLAQLNHFNSDLKELQTWERRGMATQQKLHSVIRFVETRSDQNPADLEMATALLMDFRYLSQQASEYSQHLKDTKPVVASLMSCIDTRRSFIETANISRLTYLALIFVPMSFVATLFSMNDKLALGSGILWVYFVVAMPLTSVVFAVARMPTNIFVAIGGLANTIVAALIPT